MAKIQDIREFEQRITDAINDYIQDKAAGCYEDGAWLRIFMNNNDDCAPYLDAEIVEKKGLDGDFYDPEIYALECGEPFYDNISELANDYIFLDH